MYTVPGRDDQGGVHRCPPHNLFLQGGTEPPHVLLQLQALSVSPFVCLCVCDSRKETQE